VPVESLGNDHAVAVGLTTVEAATGGIELLDAIEAQWRELCETGLCEFPFCRPEWIRAYLRAFAPHSRVVLLTARMEGKLTGILPLVEESTWYRGVPMRALRGAANWHTYRFDAVCAPGLPGQAAVFALWQRLKDLDGWSMLEFPSVPADAALRALLSHACQDGFPTAEWESIQSPYYVMPQAAEMPEWWLAPLSANFRSQVRRKSRKLAESGHIAVDRSFSADSPALARFFELEASGWKGQHGTAIAKDPRTLQFYSEIAGDAARFGYLALYLLRKDGAPIAGQFGLSYRGRYYMPKTTYDESLGEYAPGHILVKEILADCARLGLREFDFLGPNDEWKLRWTAHTRPHSSLFVFRKTLYARAVHRFRFHLVPAMRRLLDRSNGSPAR